MSNRLLLIALGLSVSTGCATNEACHLGEHVGGFEGDLHGMVVLEVSRVDAENLVDLTFEGDDAGLPLTAHLVADPARDGGCSDLGFEGELLDAGGEVVGTLEGALTTTTGEGTWRLDDGTQGTWGIGKR